MDSVIMFYSSIEIFVLHYYNYAKKENFQIHM